MTCIYCNSDLENKGPWGYLAAHQSGEVLGHTFTCPNHEGFEDEESASNYLFSTQQTMDDLGYSSWEEVVCDSAMHHVSGSFYTENGDLKEGYPC